ncbi:hypothetical protein MM300_04780 [Evansella sp. LMS18]|uniref:hypothetical protein n=1 Tax=Evansella sp. LMS18 TaxID=2924033 RepID=UPI0020D10F74|nr:hypothetical protein [Evansella sp. LMS18]UTR11630.1 hypothetical protein MM300_04780 [Evansella sp. LMS18]
MKHLRERMKRIRSLTWSNEDLRERMKRIRSLTRRKAASQGTNEADSFPDPEE